MIQEPKQMAPNKNIFKFRFTHYLMKFLFCSGYRFRVLVVNDNNKMQNDERPLILVIVMIDFGTICCVIPIEWTVVYEETLLNHQENSTLQKPKTQPSLCKLFTDQKDKKAINKHDEMVIQKSKQNDV